ncbi:3-hydroxyacyl-CoA dehydrogenase family protein [Carboxydothermus hydrogenoformans]|uniref:3-hydroxybutyryl-CoA dehydrogenase n=1 Tax=Carboxydothermus hydrogenoformans (strain ATCC BAA-161 / DSM 6008 / Z-2901) TaxID=246194 RepID=Q3ABC4_CARHZ|nr:3-hydroxyacyl-CoA dehydrogenase family protein [Carboxydothermus hydrogenoformans]ABB14715.1 3-hydroxybutyryl-CoA dehydrogenase [Carboxydothermus hydrogenoformans Z-2901]
MEVKKICVVGAGNMGHQISLAAALAGYQVTCTDINEEILNRAKNFVETYLPERVAKGKLTEEAAAKAKENLTFTLSLEEACKDVDFVIEAVIEKLDVKRELFKKLDELTPPHAILATNSSYIVSSKIADVTKRPEKVLNMHFFNPALVMKLVEVVKGPHVADETAEVTMEVARKMGKVPVLLQKEIYGFLVNRILAAIKAEAFYLYEIGIADYKDIDTAVELGLGHPMGPFRLMDLTGIDLTYYVEMERYRESRDPAMKPSPTVVEKFVKGEWGRKVGKGFYDYTQEKK